MRASGFEGKRANRVENEGEFISVDVRLLRAERGSGSAAVESGGLAASGGRGFAENDLALMEGVAGDGLWGSDEEIAVLVSGCCLDQWVFSVLTNKLHACTCHPINHHHHLLTITLHLHLYLIYHIMSYCKVAAF